METRRQQVWRLRVSHRASVEEIAEAVDASVRTVYRDLVAMKRRMQKALERAQEPDAPLGLGLEAMAELDGVTRQAWMDLAASTEGSATRAKFVNAVLRAAAQRVALLQAFGFLPLHATALDVTIHRGGREGAAERVRGRLLRLAHRLLEQHPEGLIPVEGSPVTAAVARGLNRWRSAGLAGEGARAEYTLLVVVVEELQAEFESAELTGLLRGMQVREEP